LMLYYYFCWKKIPVYKKALQNASTKISVLIAARNEEKIIGNLLTSLRHQTYPKEFFEIIVVDDHSTDKTADVVKRFEEVKLLQLREQVSNSFKKKAIETGIKHATGDLVVTTDADCTPGKEWLSIL